MRAIQFRHGHKPNSQNANHAGKQASKQDSKALSIYNFSKL